MGNEGTPTPAQAAGTTPPPAAQAAPPPAAAPPAAPAATDWTSGLNDTQKGFVQNKGFKNPVDVLEGYQNIEKLIGQKERLVLLPENMDISTPEGRAVFERLGAPKEAKGYEFKTPEGGDPKFTEWAADTFHKAGLPKAQADKVLSELTARATAIQTEQSANMKAAQQAAEVALKQEWGMAFEKNKNIVDQAARVAGIGEQETAALVMAIGPKKAADLFLKIGNSVGEAAFIGGQPPSDGNLAPQQADSKLKELQSDQGWVKRYLAGDVQAKKDMERLQQMKTGGAMARL